MTNLWSRLTIVALLFAVRLIAAWPVNAAVVIVANRTGAPIRFEGVPVYETAADTVLAAETQSALTDGASIGSRQQPNAKSTRYQIEPEQSVVVSLSDADALDVHVADLVPYRLKRWGIYYFGKTDQQRLELHEIGLGADLSQIAEDNLGTPSTQSSTQSSTQLSTEKQRQKDADTRRTLKVALFVDDDEATRQQVWEPRLKKRIAAASDILERHCGMKLVVDEVSRWNSNNATTDFDLSLREFERKAKPKQARIAIGFTSQYQLTQGRIHLGGTRGPLSSHVLLREWSNHVSEAERLELLVHELSHFFGAAHSPERRSVMRSLLGDKQARARDFSIGIDPVNTLAMNIVAIEMRESGVSSFAALSPAAAARLTTIYTALKQVLPDDPAAEQFLQILKRRAVIEAGRSVKLPLPLGEAASSER